MKIFAGIFFLQQSKPLLRRASPKRHEVDMFKWVVAMVQVVSEEQRVNNWTRYQQQWSKSFISKTKLDSAHKNVTCIPETLTLIINANLEKLMTPPSQWALDETVIACEIQGAPTVYLPRKPHSTGLRIYSCVAMNEKAGRPFCFGIVNDAKTPHLKLDEILSEADACFDSTGKEPFAMTGDAFFEKLDWITGLPEGRFATLAMGKVRSGKLLEVFTHGLEKKQLRTFYNGSLMAQVWVGNDTVAVVSNQFEPTDFEPTGANTVAVPERSDPGMLHQTKSALKMQLDAVLTLADISGKSAEGTKAEIVARMFNVDVRDLVAGKQGALAALFSCDCDLDFRDHGAVQCSYCSGWSHYPECVVLPEGEPWHCKKCRTDPLDSGSDAKWNWDVEERRNSKFNMTQLKENIGKLNGKTSGSKDVLVKRLTSLEKPGDELAKAQAALEAAMVMDTSRNKPTIIKHYGETFNPVDMINRLMYEVWFHPKVRDWRRRYLLGMISLLLVNSWVAYRDFHGVSRHENLPTLKSFCADIVRLYSTM